jgi:quinoprotein glucose dehydrogenase
VLAALACSGALPAVSRGPPEPVPDTDWPHYLGDLERSHASPLGQITPANVDRLERAWTFDTGPKDGVFSEMQCSPIVVDGVLYLTNHSAVVFALDAATGAERWRFDPVANGSPAQTRNRGVAHWRAADGSGARIFASSGNHLWALDARTGVPLAGFGEGGRIDLARGLAHTGSNREVSVTTPGAVYRDLLILGTRVSEAAGAAPGDVRAFDVRTGAMRWSFHTVPYEGELGADTWPAGAAKEWGGANSWAGVAVDSERGLVFAPTGSAAPDFFGGDRPGDNLFANSLIALDANTGERRWHFQTVRHDLWDRDLPSPPNLVTIEREGRAIDAVAQTSKSGFVFLFERETGEPVFPIEQRRVPRDPVEGEALSEVQPFPTAPPPFTRQGFSLAMVEQGPRTQAWRERLPGMRMGKPFIPPSLEGTVMYPGYDGGAEWGGSAWDADTGLLYVNASEVASLLKLLEPSGDLDVASVYQSSCASCHGADLNGTPRGASLRGVAERRTPVEIYTAIIGGSGQMPGFPKMPMPMIGGLIAYLSHPDDPESAKAAVAQSFRNARYVHEGYIDLVDDAGIPIHYPPWGTLTAIDLGKGELRWQVPLGAYPELAERGLTDTGTPNYGGPIVTASGLLFIAATADETFRAFDKKTGELLWRAPLPASGFATPITYAAGGRQYVVVAAGGGKLRRRPGTQFVAFALP